MRRHIDAKRIYASGFSNGGAFTYFLWANRPAVFAAVAPMADLPWPTEPPTVPKPAFIVAGQADNLVPIQSQVSIIARIRELDKAATAKPFPLLSGEGQGEGTTTTLYESSINAPVVTLIHAGGHELPPRATKLRT
jgi:polyhydroxybutyrate depolymerase